MSLLLVLKIILVPSLIGGVTLAGRRWGPEVAGWLSAFPVVSAPILYFIAREQGAVFAAKAAVATLSAVLAILVFGISYAWMALRRGCVVSALCAFAAYAVAVVVLQAWAPSLPAAAVAVFLALVTAPKSYPLPPAPPKTPASPSVGDLAWRMITGAVLVLLVTRFSPSLGPRLSGLFAMFPVITSVLAVFSHIHAGAGFAIRQLRGMVPGLYAFASFCAVLSLALPRMGVGLAFGLALLAALAVQGGSRLYANDRPQIETGAA